MRHLITKRLARRLTWARDGELTPRFGGKKLSRQVRRAITRDTRREVEHAHAEIWEAHLDAFMEALFDASPVRYADPLTYGARTRTGAYVASAVVDDGWQNMGYLFQHELALEAA